MMLTEMFVTEAHNCIVLSLKPATSRTACVSCEVTKWYVVIYNILVLLYFLFWKSSLLQLRLITIDQTACCAEITDWTPWRSCCPSNFPTPGSKHGLYTVWSVSKYNTKSNISLTIQPPVFKAKYKIYNIIKEKFIDLFLLIYQQ